MTLAPKVFILNCFSKNSVFQKARKRHYSLRNFLKN